MTTTDSWTRLAQFDKHGRHVYTKRDLGMVLGEHRPRHLQTKINALVKTGVLTRAVKGVYVFTKSKSFGLHTLEYVARSMRRGEYNYISLESALSEYGVISQIPMGRITVMTTGRSGEYKTPFGTIEFVHTNRPLAQLLQGAVDTGRPLKIATKQVAWRDLKRVGRNLHMVDEEMLTTTVFVSPSA
ncbi:type IV toxin-antitoxin system AbiEi family antitoxin [Ferrimonas marina]|uniref:Transcriptional regulator, AbiEi antitoxin, Type IV TA system n=1 Tax=Ferrimonas marina TaxID=299255 RepID=A0A1M5TRD9_9GAMM|nr:hypothetical protein [Ferrimonas marina]SHH53269.1 Transcriptional regulator, AbiEi antitoxin, Type IV TA system [Ferrimonas marina]